MNGGSSPMDPGDRFEVEYRITCGEGEQVEAKALDIALEQTVELPRECVGPELMRRVAGRVESVGEVGPGAWRARISFPGELVAGDLSQLLNLLFGNVSMKSGIRVERLHWTEPLLQSLGGPRFGISGLRSLCGVTSPRALTCTVLKPLGLSTEELAEHCRAFARGGIDIVKDDHSLANQAMAPFRERVVLCQEAVESEAEASGSGSGHRTLYFPHITGSWPEMMHRMEFARERGCKGVLVSPMVAGLAGIRRLAEESGLAILGHPALAGAYFGRDHGIAAELLLGELFRIAGCDGVVFPNAGGRFSLSPEECRGIIGSLKGPLGPVRPSMPVPAGGIAAQSVPDWLDRYGPDTMFLLGGSLYGQSNLEHAARGFAQAVGAQSDGGSTQEG